jgi:hypothetical protein
VRLEIGRHGTNPIRRRGEPVLQQRAVEREAAQLGAFFNKASRIVPSLGIHQAALFRPSLHIGSTGDTIHV